jgi:hypothetical protein
MWTNKDILNFTKWPSRRTIYLCSNWRENIADHFSWFDPSGLKKIGPKLTAHPFRHCGNELNPLQSPPYFMANRVRAYSKIDVYAAQQLFVVVYLHLHKCARASLFTTFLGLAAISLIATSIAQINQSQTSRRRVGGAGLWL